MLVGVGLSQVNLIGAKFRSFSDFLSDNAKVFGETASANAGALPVVGPFILIFGIVSGFVFFYLYTRIYLSPLFQRVEDELSAHQEPGSKTLDVGKVEIQKAAAQLAENSANPSMTYAAVTDTLSINQSLDVIFNLLYEKGGYEKAISLGNTIAKTPATKLAKYWFLMCAALSQKHHMMKKNKASSEELKVVRISVLDAARQAVRLDPKFKIRLKALLNPDNIDNDLQDFQHDPDMLRILG